MKKQLKQAVVVKEKNFTASKEKPNVKKLGMVPKTITKEKVAKTAGIAGAAKTPAIFTGKHTTFTSIAKTIAAVAEPVKKTCLTSPKEQPVNLLKKNLLGKTGKEEMLQEGFIDMQDFTPHNQFNHPIIQPFQHRGAVFIEIFERGRGNWQSFIGKHFRLPLQRNRIFHFIRNHLGNERNIITGLAACRIEEISRRGSRFDALFRLIRIGCRR